MRPTTDRIENELEHTGTVSPRGNKKKSRYRCRDGQGFYSSLKTDLLICQRNRAWRRGGGKFDAPDKKCTRRVVVLIRCGDRIKWQADVITICAGRKEAHAVFVSRGRPNDRLIARVDSCLRSQDCDELVHRSSTYLRYFSTWNFGTSIPKEGSKHLPCIPLKNTRTVFVYRL